MSEEQSDGFVRALTRCQDRLYVYIRTLLPSVEAAQEVLQETNVVLLRKQAEMKPGQNFEAFACRVAYYEVLSYMRDRARDRHRFDESLLELLAANAAQTSDKAAARLDALQECLRPRTALLDHPQHIRQPREAPQLRPAGAPPARWEQDRPGPPRRGRR